MSHTCGYGWCCQKQRPPPQAPKNCQWTYLTVWNTSAFSFALTINIWWTYIIRNFHTHSASFPAVSFLAPVDYMVLLGKKLHKFKSNTSVRTYDMYEIRRIYIDWPVTRITFDLIFFRSGRYPLCKEVSLSTAVWHSLFYTVPAEIINPGDVVMEIEERNGGWIDLMD